MRKMKELIEYLNQSGLTDLLRIYMVVGGILFLAVFIAVMWMAIRILRRVFNNREKSILDFQHRSEERRKTFNS